MADKKIVATITATLLASLCCVTPVLAVIAGSSSLATSFSWMEPYHNYLIALTIIILLYAWWDKLKSKSDGIDCDCEQEYSFFSSKKFLAIVTIFSILMLSFPKWGYTYFEVEESCDSCVTEIIIEDKTIVEDKKILTQTKEPSNDNTLPVLKYMNDEKIDPTECNQKACSGTGFKILDDLMADARKDVEEMSPVVLKKMIDNEEEFILLDIRDLQQRAEGSIYADDTYAITRGDLEFDVMNKIINKDSVIVVYCRSGGRSLFAAQTLKHLGYKNVYNLSAGLKGWARAGYPFDNGLGVVVKVEEE